MTTREQDLALAQRVQRLAADPRVTGALFGTGAAIATILDGGMHDQVTLGAIQDLALGPQRTSGGPVTAPGRSDQDLTAWYAERRLDPIRELLRKDIRRYQPPAAKRVCQAPMPRKGRCDRSSSRSTLLTDWTTGQRQWCEACTRHTDWWTTYIAEHARGRPEIVPQPYANTGGALARHFPEIDWPRLWHELDPHWEPRPEREPAESSPPTLQVITSEPAPPSKHSHTRQPSSRSRARLILVLDLSEP
ncbi:hypothetical protein [Amycolatopsis orientalis]|uniref:hypothetical protein n=1 Tax=Amycolatopsis orientalis TaxID=31958 RepID=UPI00056B9B42|nr:hypothetical protein [Amycolatopsis orientalis]